MITIRIPKQQWGKAWRAMIDIAPVRLVADDPLYEVLPAHLELLDARGIAYEFDPGPKGAKQTSPGQRPGIQSPTSPSPP